MQQPRSFIYALTLLMLAGLLLPMDRAMGQTLETSIHALPIAHATNAHADTGVANDNDDPKNVLVAQGLAIGAVVLPAGLTLVIDPGLSGLLLASGIILGPSAGSLYAEDTWRAVRGVGIRAGGTAIYLAGTGALEQPMLFVGVGVVTFSIIVDIVASSVRSVEEYNERFQNTDHAVSVLPWLGPDGKTPGLRVRLSF